MDLDDIVEFIKQYLVISLSIGVAVFLLVLLFFILLF